MPRSREGSLEMVADHPGLLLTLALVAVDSIPSTRRSVTLTIEMAMCPGPLAKSVRVDCFGEAETPACWETPLTGQKRRQIRRPLAARSPMHRPASAGRSWGLQTGAICTRAGCVRSRGTAASSHRTSSCGRGTSDIPCGRGRWAQRGYGGVLKSSWDRISIGQGARRGAQALCLRPEKFDGSLGLIAR